MRLGGQQDAMVVREAGWIQMYCETVQEILDTTVMAYKIAEHHDVMLPVNICHDGNYLSFGVTRVELPDQQAVDEFLGPPNINWHIALDPEGDGRRSAHRWRRGPGPRNFVRYRKGQCRGMQSSLRIIRECTPPGASASTTMTRRWSRNIDSTTPTMRW